MAGYGGWGAVPAALRAPTAPPVPTGLTRVGPGLLPGVAGSSLPAPLPAQAPGAANSSRNAPAPFVQPPIPTGFYDPIRDIELAAGKKNAENTVEDIGTQRIRGGEDFTHGEEELGEGEQTSLGLIKQATERLAGKQAEQENATGTLYGGARLAAAAARAGNETKEREPVVKGYETALGKLVTAHGREGEDLGTKEHRTEHEQEQFGIDTQTLEGREAANNGYIAPSAPPALKAALAAPPRTRVGPGLLPGAPGSTLKRPVSNPTTRFRTRYGKGL